jgi:biotin carboxyl carrier protein
MRYYFVNQEMKDVYFDLEVQDGTYTINSKEYFVKKLAGKFYFSVDKINWEKLAIIPKNSSLVSNSEIYKVYRGYKPSGLTQVTAGSLVTQMPGKVVKIFFKDGDKVTKGQTVLILEAMKMENEIKAGIDGTLKNLSIKEGQALESGYLMGEIE